MIQVFGIEYVHPRRDTQAIVFTVSTLGLYSGPFEPPFFLRFCCFSRITCLQAYAHLYLVFLLYSDFIGEIHETHMMNLTQPTTCMKLKHTMCFCCVPFCGFNILLAHDIHMNLLVYWKFGLF